MYKNTHNQTKGETTYAKGEKITSRVTKCIVTHTGGICNNRSWTTESTNSQLQTIFCEGHILREEDKKGGVLYLQ